MSLCLTESSLLCSNDPEAEQPSGHMELSTLALNLRALNLLDTSLRPPAKFATAGVESSDGKPENKSLPIIHLDEVAWHDTIDDCWMVICDYVYDCTRFLKNHPGGQDVLLEYAGRDATLAFIGTGHSQGAKRLLERFLIGELPVSERIFRTPNGIKVGDFV